MAAHQVIIVGGGLAGLSAALQMDPAVDTAVISKVHPLRSHSVAAQGGINAALGNHPEGRDDTPERHAFDTVKGSDYLADQDAVQLMCDQAVPVLYELEHTGVPFSRFPDGTIAQRPFGGAGYPRSCYATDRTGHMLLHTLYERCVARKVQFYPEVLVCRLVLEGDRCAGLVVLDVASGAVDTMQADAVVLATGGYGRVFQRSTNAYINTGSGIGLAYGAGLALEDMEFVQFHPTSLYGSNILITEGARGEGGHLVNADGHRFMADYAPSAMELAPRDIVARAIQSEIDQGRGIGEGYVHLDLRHLGAERIGSRLPGIREIAMTFGYVDPINEPIPVQPAQHYSMGGVAVDKDGASSVAGVFAAGECACVSVHGANRLGGNSLLDTVVFGRIAGGAAGRYAVDADRPGGGAASLADAASGIRDDIRSWQSRSTGPRPHELSRRLQAVMAEKIGLNRTQADLEAGVAAVRQLQEDHRQLRLASGSSRFSQELVAGLEAEAMLAVAAALSLGAMERCESRGSHFRTDYPQRDDDAWLRHTLARRGPDGPQLSHSPVTIGPYLPQERVY
jgi:succinate dehydrogenase / fumarate reductase, flavoprotein subunit